VSWLPGTVDIRRPIARHSQAMLTAKAAPVVIMACPFLFFAAALPLAGAPEDLSALVVTWLALSLLADVVAAFVLARFGRWSARTATVWAESLTVAAGNVLIAGPSGATALPLMLPYLLIVPGLIWLAPVGGLRLGELIVLSIALSLAVDVSVASLLVLQGGWSARAEFAFVGLVTLTGLVVTRGGVRTSSGLTRPPPKPLKQLPSVSPAYDTTVPVLISKTGRHELAHGALGAIRSLGRVGIPVFAMAEDPFVPYGFSRYLTKRLVHDTSHSRDAILEALLKKGEDFARPAVLMPADDEAAILAAENNEALAAHFLSQPAPPKLVRQIASKGGLNELCTRFGVATPRTFFAPLTSDVLALAETLSFPLVVKNSEPWKRLLTPAVQSTTRINSLEELIALSATWKAEPHIILQEYIPGDVSEDWIVHAYSSRSGENDLLFTGRKFRSWPPEAGVTTAAAALPNEPLAEMASGFLRDIGYYGIADMDWRFDARDGRYKLVDFNPRIGANFRLFETEAGIDVVRAAHLELTGRVAPAAPQLYDRRLIVENLDLASRLVIRTAAGRLPGGAGGGVEYAWFAKDDPLPFFAMTVRFGAGAFARLWSMLRKWSSQRFHQPAKAPRTAL